MSNQKNKSKLSMSHWIHFPRDLTSAKKGGMPRFSEIKEKMGFVSEPLVHWTGADKVYK